jgi:tetratricopeptide (TPR) repeat protein
MLPKQDGDFRLALKKLQEAEFFNPSYPDVRKQIKLCKKEIARLVQMEKNQKLAEKAYQSGEQYLEGGKAKLAAREFMKGAKLDPRMKLRAMDWRIKGLASLKAGNKKMAVDYFRLTLALDPGDVKAQVALMQTYYNLNDKTALEKHSTNFKAQFPRQTETSQEVVQSLYKDGMKAKHAGDFQGAVNGFKLVAMLDPGLKENNEQLAICQAEVKRQAVLAANQKKAQENYDQGTKLFDKKEYPEALGRLSLAIKLDERFQDKAGKWYNQGDKAAVAMSPVEAINYLKVAILLDIGLVKAHIRLAEVWIPQPKGPAEIKPYYAALKKKYSVHKVISTILPDLFFRAGRNSQKEEKYGQALAYFALVKTLDKYYKKIDENISLSQHQVKIEKATRQAQTHFDNGLKKVNAGQYKEAEALFKKAGKLNPTYADYISLVKKQGLKDIKNGKFNAASKKLGMAVSKNVGDVMLHKDIIDACIKSKNMKYLSSLYKNLTAEHPFNPTLRKTLPDYYYNQAQKHKRAGKFQLALFELEVVKVLKPQYKGVGVDNQIKALKTKIK